MADNPLKITSDPIIDIERVSQLSDADMNDLCDAADAAIKAGGGFGWVNVPDRDGQERFWQGVLAMPTRTLIVAKLDHVIAGACQLVAPPPNNEAQAHAVQFTTHFTAPWARGHSLATKLVQKAEEIAREDGFHVINLDVRETMESAMMLYEAQGFERIGEHPHYAEIDGEVLKGYYYCKVIG